VVSAKDPTNPLAREVIDYQTSSLDLGRWLRPDFAHFPKRAAYLAPDTGMVAAFREKYAPLRAGGKRLIGLSWKSRSAFTGAEKSLALAEWQPILDTADCAFISVQYGAEAGELAAALRTGHVIHHDATVDSLKDLDTFAAQLAALDLVISVSNTAVHVAGALGVPTWVIVPEGKGGLWYWFERSDATPWYPSIRLFRRRPGHNISAEIAAALRP
jgi:ADP-heptose:LPS heptosyltransferase